MQFNRMTKEDINNLAGFLLEQGTCSFVIKNAEEVFAKSSGDLQMKVELEVTDINDKTAKITDYIFYSQKALWKIVSFCKSIDLEDKLLEGSLEPRDVINKKGQLIVKHEEYQGEKKNKILRYLPYLDMATQQASTSEKPFVTDDENDLPF